MTQILNDINKAAELIKQDELVAFPTETVYGLGASLFSVRAIEKIYAVKKRPPDNPLIAHFHSVEQIEEVTQDIPDNFYKLASVFFPGPLTILLPKKSSIPAIACANLPTIGVRIPAHPTACHLIEAVGSPLVAPSANLSGRPSSTTVEHVLEDFEGKIAAVLDGAPCQYGLESTVIALSPKLAILRLGAIKKEEIESVLGESLEYSNAPVCPGMKYRHYAPSAVVRLFKTKEQLKKHVAKNPRIKRKIVDSICSQNLYSVLRVADQIKVDEILIFLNKNIMGDHALLDRLIRVSEAR